MMEKMTPDQLQWVVDHDQQIMAVHRTQILDAVTAWRDTIRERDALLAAAKHAVAQFRAIQQHQEDLLITGQTLESAEANWDEATLGLSIDFQPLIDALAQIEKGQTDV